AAAEGDIAGMRVAYSPDLGYAAVDPQVRQITDRAALVFERDLGCTVEHADPGWPDPYETLWGLVINESDLSGLRKLADSLGDRAGRVDHRRAAGRNPDRRAAPRRPRGAARRRGLRGRRAMARPVATHTHRDGPVNHKLHPGPADSITSESPASPETRPPAAARKCAQCLRGSSLSY